MNRDDDHDSWGSYQWSWSKGRDDDRDQVKGRNDDRDHGGPSGGNNREWPWMKNDNDGAATDGVGHGRLRS